MNEVLLLLLAMTIFLNSVCAGCLQSKSLQYLGPLESPEALGGKMQILT